MALSRPPLLRMLRAPTLKPAAAGCQVGEARRAGTVERIRGSALQVIRDRILTRDAGRCRCAECIRTGRLQVAAQVDHRRPLWEGGAEDDANRYAIAAGCHDIKTRCEASRRAAPARWVCLCARCDPSAGIG